MLAPLPKDIGTILRS